MDWEERKNIIKYKIEKNLNPKKLEVESCCYEGIIEYQVYLSPTGNAENWDTSWDYFQKAVTLDPKCVLAWGMLAHLLARKLQINCQRIYRQGHDWTAIKNYEIHDQLIMDWFDRSIQLNSKDSLIWYLRAEWLLCLPHHTRYDDKEIDGEVMKDLNKALKLNPQYDDALLLKGDFCHRLKKFEDAISCYEKIIRKFPNKWLRGLAAGNPLDPSDHPTRFLIAALCHRGTVLGNTNNPSRNLDDAAFCFKIACNLNSYSTPVDLVVFGLGGSSDNTSYGEYAEHMLDVIDEIKNKHDEGI